MYCIEIPKEINKFMSLFYCLGLWHRGDRATVRETRIKLFYCFYHLLLPLSTLVGAIKTDNRGESIFLGEVTIAFCIVSIKLFYIMWKKDQIIEVLTRISVYSMENREEFILANDKIKRLIKFMIVLLLIISIAAYAAVLVPVFRKENYLFLNIGFPFDYKNNEIAFWLANAFILTEMTLSLIGVLFAVIIWFLMINCALRYEILGIQIRNMGVRPTIETTIKLNILVVERQQFFLSDLIAAIDSQQNIRELINQVKSFLANIFFMQTVTSGICICCSVYCLAFNVGDNLVEQFIHLASLFYYISDILVIMYFGNEIKLSSDRLTYFLFESDWIDQPQETKKCIIIFGELLQKPHELVIGYLYPLTLETFRRILNFAYKMFNILKNLK